ncbi:hypothetical protein [Rubrivirga marina]|uniref:Secreted protein n=1 Tax=Rubrivirga marina TaxID=1196024 RepID=A0A271IWB3_9BACT|nr:hypothetical protein [Rubrivirga marina]PAP75218.1 hypothetical protein BSZ37_01550 [Rubrivirga marina]
MLAVLLALLSALAGVSPSGMADDFAEGAEVVSVAHPADACCGVVGENPEHPCTPGEPCTPAGGCCACASCGQRVLSTPPTPRPDVAASATRHAVPSAGPTGTDAVGAVWHPPRG